MLRRLRTEERGTTLMELVIATAAGGVIFMGLTMVVMASMHQTTRTQNRVHATQEARLVMQRIVTELHSSCVAADVSPIQESSNGTSLGYVYGTGSGAAITPVMHKVFLSGNTLYLSTYPSTTGSTPKWTFSGTATSTVPLISNVAPVTSGGPIFTYYTYSSGAISSSPLTVPLSGTNAAKAVQVNIALKVEPRTSTVSNPGNPAVIQNSAFLRYSPPSANVNAANLPCE
ncbi:MAG TPA: hypothetical protein VMT37_13530 [Solirubrobacterales bacterium]|nr:hypothetical protein [Solirubrobacterales bacterium]